jgi:hypothetical protein
MDANLEIKTLAYDGVDIKPYLTDRNGNGALDIDDWELVGSAGIGDSDGTAMPQDGTVTLADIGVNHNLLLTIGLRSETGGANQGDVVTTTFSVIGHQLDGE